jgi:uncharacterized protein YhdP
VSPVVKKRLKLTLKVIAALLIVLLISFALLLWRLSSSPIELNQFVPRIEQAASDLPGGLGVRLKGINLFWNRAERKIDLKALDVELLESSGSSLVNSPEVNISLSVFALMRGVVALSSVELVDVDVQLVRREDGSFQVFKGKTTKQSEQAVNADEANSRNYSEIVQNVFKVLASETDPQKPISYLKNLKIKGSLEVEDRKSGLNWTADAVETMFVGHKGEIKGDLSVILDTPRSLAGVSADVALSVKQESVKASLKVAELQPAALAHFDQRLRALTGLDMKFDADINLEMTLPDKIHSLKADISGGVGQLSYLDYYPTPLKISSFGLQLSADLAGKSLQISSLDVSLGEAGTPLTLHLTGAAQMADDAVSLKLDTQLQHLKVSEFDLYWPREVAQGARSWLVSNLKAGTVDNTKLHLDMVVPTAPGTDFELKELNGTVAYSGLTVSYFGSLPPATAVNGSGTYNQHGFNLVISKGLVNGVNIDSGKVVISGLDNKKAAIAIDTHLSGGLAAIFSALEAQPIELNRITGIDSNLLGGQFESDFSIAFPLRSGLSKGEIKYQANGKISEGSRQNLVGGYHAQAANVEFQLDPSNFKLNGPMEFSGIPITIDLHTALAGNTKGHSDFTVDAANISEAQISALGYDVSEYIKGSLALKATGSLAPGRVVTATVNSTLDETEISIPQLQWHKASGEDGSIDFTLRAGKGGFQAKDINAVLGSLKTRGNTEVEFTGSNLSLLLKHVTVGRSSFENVKLGRSGAGHFSLAVDGGELDLASFLPGNDQQSTPQTKQLVAKTEGAVSKLDSSGIVLEVGKSRLDKIYLNKDTFFDNIEIEARRDTQGWQEFSLSGHNPFATKDGTSSDPSVTADSLKPGQLKAIYGPPDNGRYPVHIEVENLGLLASAVKGRTIMEGGYLVLSGESSGPLLTQAINTTFEVDNFTVKDAPGFSQVLNLASLDQLVSTFQNTGLAFNSFSGDLKLDGTHLSSKHVHAKGGSLGLMGSGSANLKLGTVDLIGTVVPFSNINDAIGLIPILGKAVVGHDGKGLLAIEFTIKGDSDDPVVAVNKKSATSDILKDILDTGKKDEQKTSQ